MTTKSLDETLDEIWATLGKEVGEAWKKYDGQAYQEYELDDYGDAYDNTWYDAKQRLLSLIQQETNKARIDELEAIKKVSHWVTEVREDKSTMSGRAVMITRINGRLAQLKGDKE